MFELRILERWVESKLSEALDCPYFRDLAPQGTPFPHVVWSWQTTGGDDRAGGRQHTRPVLLIRVFSEVGEDSEEDAEPVMVTLESTFEDAHEETEGLSIHTYRFGVLRSAQFGDSRETSAGHSTRQEGSLWQFITRIVD